MHPILIFRHVEIEGPGFFGEFLHIHNIPFRMIYLDKEQHFPRDLDKVSALVFMGGPMSVNDPLPWISDELDLIRRAHERSLPMLGHCLGGQLISKALGGEVTRNPVSEIGWHQVRQTPGKAASLWLKDIASEFEVFHWHGETFSLPDGAELILDSQYCQNQAFVIGKTLAMQCHIEMTAEMVKEWAEAFTDTTLNQSLSVQSKAEMQKRLPEKIKALQLIASKIYTQWLHGLE
jgi:GMP synthase-like glutamine amidotransferase